MRDGDKPRAVEIARSLASARLQLWWPRAAPPRRSLRPGSTVTPVNKVAEGRPHIVDMIKNGEIALIVNTVEEKRTAVRDSYAIRRAALQERVTLYTTLAGARAACTGMQQARELQGLRRAGFARAYPCGEFTDRGARNHEQDSIDV